jgi:hypothetical protein
MHILLWLVPPVVVTLLAMMWAAWAGRPRPEPGDRSEAGYERFAAAISRPHPAALAPRPPARRDRSTGIAVRPSRAGVRPAAGSARTRRPA